MSNSSRNKTITKDNIDKSKLKGLLPDNTVYGLNKIYNLEYNEFYKLIPDNSVDLLITDPPYNLRKKYNQSVFNPLKDEEYIKFTREWIESFLPKLKENASVYICSDWKSSILISSILGDYFHIRNRITWEREKGRGSKTNWKNNSEDIWFCTMSNDYTFNEESVKLKRKVIAPYKQDGEAKDWYDSDEGKFRLTSPSNLWTDISVPFWSMSENTEHPTQKPEKLIAKLILASSNEGDTVLDCFMGSGTTAVVANKLNRNFTGCEKELEYTLIAYHRLEQSVNNKVIQGYEEGIFLDRNLKT